MLAPQTRKNAIDCALLASGHGWLNAMHGPGAFASDAGKRMLNWQPVELDQVGCKKCVDG